MGWKNRDDDLYHKLTTDKEFSHQYYKQAINSNREQWKLSFSDYIKNPSVAIDLIDGEGIIDYLQNDADRISGQEQVDIENTRKDLEIAKIIKDQAWQDTEDSWKGLVGKYFENNDNIYTADSARKTVDFFNAAGVDLSGGQVEFITKQLDKNEWESSPFYRKELQFQPYWTMNMAREKALNYDTRVERQKLIDEGGMMSQVYGLVASVPAVLASPSGVAMVASGVALAPVSIGSAFTSIVAKDAIGMAVGEAVQLPGLYYERGQELTKEEYAKGIFHGAITGAAFGAAHYGISKIINKIRGKSIDPKTGMKEVTTEEMEALAFENSKITEKDKFIEMTDIDNQLRMMNGEDPFSLELKSNQYYDVTGNEILELPTQRVNINSYLDSSVSQLGGRWRVVELDDIKTPYNIQNNRLVSNKEYPLDIFKDYKPASEKISVGNVSVDRLLKKSDSIHDGFPTIDKNGNVLIGSENALAIKENYLNGDIMSMKKDLISKGFKDAENMEKPTLMFELTDDIKVGDLKKLAKKEIQQASSKAIEQLEQSKSKVENMIREKYNADNVAMNESDMQGAFDTDILKEYEVKPTSIEELDNFKNIFEKNVDMSSEKLKLEAGQEGMSLYDAKSVAEANEQDIFSLKRIKEKLEQFYDCIL